MLLNANHFRTTTIDGVPYQIKIMNGLQGFRTLNDLKSVVLPILGESFDAKRHDDVLHGAPKTFKDMAVLLCTQVDNIDIEDIIFNRLLGYLVRDGVQVKLEEIIMGDYGILIELVFFALKENFGKMFEGKGLATRFQETVAKINNQI